MNTIRLALFFLFLFSPFSCVFAQDLNAGFVQGIWYSKTPFFAGDTIRIYTAIQNNSGFDIQGTAEFLVDGKNIGESSFSAVNSRIVETWTDWKVTKGNHSVVARIKEAFRIEIGKTPEPISLNAPQLGEVQIFADQDTDNDQMGNLEDTDDDNDGLEDSKEIELGTNPLSKDTDQDGISDAAELAQGSNPVVAEQESKENSIETPLESTQDSFVAKAAEKLTKEYLPSLTQQVDSFVETTTEKLKERKGELEEKKKAFAAGEIQEPLSIPEQGLDFLLASAIIALPQWQIGLFFFFAIATALLLRRFSKEQAPEK